ncbi:phage terminase large subunit [Sphingobium yanoikuyae]
MAGEAKQPKGIVPTFKFNDDQKQAYALATNALFKYLLFYGPSRSGKSFLILYLIFLRALRAPNSRHACFRGARNACERSLFKLTLNQVFDKCFSGLKSQCEIRLSDMTVHFPNGSEIMFGGLDSDRLDTVLGLEYNTVWINECNDDEIDYETVSQLMSRLAMLTYTSDGKQLTNKMFFDCNPKYFSDWEYKAFKLHINPSDGDALEESEEWVSCKLNTTANLDNLAPDYMKRLTKGSKASRQRFMIGEWCDENSDALFTDTMFVETRIPLAPDIEEPEAIKDYLAGFANDKIENIRLDRITIAVDPAKSNDTKSDLHGITIQAGATVFNLKEGVDEYHAFVLADHSMKASPNAVCELIRDEFKAWGAQRIVIESNAAGSWLESTMRSVWSAAPLKFIAATSQTGGKNDRAEPVAAQYERGAVHHVGTLRPLEEQMCDWGSPASRRKSPDRMDAVVWGITELLDLAHEKKAKPGAIIINAGNRRR